MNDFATDPPSIARMLRGYSSEVNPNQPKVVDAAATRLDPGTEVFLTWIPNANPMNIIGPAAKLRSAGLIPVPHIGARHLVSAAQLKQLAARLVDEAGIDRVLIIGGDRAEPAGPYDSSLAVMRTEVFQKLGVTRMAVSGFPEGNPNISDIVLEETLAAKINFASDNGLELSIVTQFCFKAEPIVEWLQRLRARGIDIPVRVGLAGPAGILTLTRYALHCGIGNSLRVLTEHPSFAKLLTENGPEPIIRSIAQGIAATAYPGDSALPQGIAGLHFYVFGGFNKTLDWIHAHQG